MSKKPKGGKRAGSGRKKIEFTIDDFRGMKRLAAAQCTKEEVCGILGVSESLLDKRLAEAGTNWTEFFTRHRQAGLASLRRAMFKNAIEHEIPVMQIWLSKNHLGMVDKTEVGFDPEKPIRFRLSMGKTINNTDKET